MFEDLQKKKKDQQKSKQNQSGSLFGTTTTGGLFGSTSTTPNLGAPTGGLFGSGNPSLFSSNSNTNLIKSQRKQGGLFSIMTPRPVQQNQQPPKLNFPGLTQNPPTPATGGLFSSNTSKVQDNKNQNTGSLFSSNSPLFGGSTPSGPSGGLFGNPSTTSNQPQGGLFGGNLSVKNPDSQKSIPSQQKKQPAKNQSGGLFGNTNTPSFGSTPTNFGGSLFGASKQNKKEQTTGGIFGSKKAETPLGPTGGLFGKKQEKPLGQTEGLFGSKKQQTSSLSSGGLFGSKQTAKLFEAPSSGGLFGTPNTNTPVSSTPLFGNQIVQKKPQQQKPKFSLVSGLTPSPQINTPSEQKKQEKPSSLFGSMTSSKQQNKPSLFSSNTEKPSGEQKSIQKVQKQPVQSVQSVQSVTNKLIQTKQPAGLFGDNISKPAQTLLNDSKSSLFGGPIKTTDNSVQQSSIHQQSISKPEQKLTKPAASLFDNNSGLFSSSNKVPTATTNLTQKKTQQSKQKQKPIQQQQQQKQGGLFSSTIIQSQNVQRTMSFNQKSDNIVGDILFNQPKQAKQTKASQSVQSSTLRTPTINKSTLGSIQSVPTDALPAKPPKPPSRSFFQSQQQKFHQLSQRQQKPLQSKDIIYTAYQINKLISLLQKQKHSSSLSIGSSRCDRLIPKQTLKHISQWILLNFTRHNSVQQFKQQHNKLFKLHQIDDVNRFMNNIISQAIPILNLQNNEKSYKFVNKLFMEMLDKLCIKEYLFECQKVQIKSALGNKQVKINIVQLNNAYFIKHQIYKIQSSGLIFNPQSPEVQHYIISLIKKFITNQLQYLQFLQSKQGIELMKLPNQLFAQLLQYNLTYKKFRINTININIKGKNQQIINLIQDFQRKIIKKVTIFLKKYINENFYTFKLIQKERINKLIILLQNFSYNEQFDIVDVSLKTMLNSFNLEELNTVLTSNLSSNNNTNNINNINTKIQQFIPSSTRNTIKETRSLQLLPFRVIFLLIQTTSCRALPTSSDLYRYINGPEWIDWLQIYLNNGKINDKQKQIHITQAKHLIKILKYPNQKLKRIDRNNLSIQQSKYIQNLQKKILSRKRPIYKFIMALKQQNMLNIFYQILISLIYDYQSYRRVEEMFFKQKDQFNYQFRNVIAEITNFPIQKFNEDIPFIQQKILYFLRIVEVAPEKTLVLQKHLFEGALIHNKKVSSLSSKVSTKMINQSLQQQLQVPQVGHKICHLLIDCITYFSIQYHNQHILSKCISSIKSLLLSQQTSMAMKLAMSINKPQFQFLSSSFLSSKTIKIKLSEQFIKQMNQLLLEFLICDNFVNSIVMKGKSNNSDDVCLERMYPLRYSYKDYLPFIRELLISNNNNININIDNDNDMRNQITAESIQTTSISSNITINYSSYWMFKCLQVLIIAIKQQKYTNCYNNQQILYIVNIILQKLFIIPSNHINDINIINKNNNSNCGFTSEPLSESKPSNTPIYSSSSSTPKILVYLSQSLNKIDILSIISQNLKYKFSKTSYKFQQQQQNHKKSQRHSQYLIHNVLLQDNYHQNQIIVYLTIKIFKNLLKLYRLNQQYKNKMLFFNGNNLNQYQNKYQDNKYQNKYYHKQENMFMYKVLNKLKCIEQLQYKVFLKKQGQGINSIIDQCINTNNNSRPNLIIGLLSIFLINYWQNNSIWQQQQQQHSFLESSKPISAYLHNKLCQLTLPCKPINITQQLYQKPYRIPLQYESLHMNKKSSILTQIQLFYSQYNDVLDYESMNNFMNIGKNKYIQGSQSIQDVVIQCFKLIVNSNNGLFKQLSQQQLHLNSISTSTSTFTSISTFKSTSISTSTKLSLSQYMGNFSISSQQQQHSYHYTFFPSQTNQFLLCHFYTYTYYLLLSPKTHLSLKQSLLQLLYQSIITPQLNIDLYYITNIVYKYLGEYMIRITNQENKVNKQQQLLRVNLIVMKIINLLIEKDKYNFTNKINDKLIDNFIITIINNTLNKTIKNSHHLIKLIQSFTIKKYHQPYYSYFNLQRILQQRKIITVGQSYQLLEQIIKIIQKRFFNLQQHKQKHKFNCIKKINSLIISCNLQYITSMFLHVHPSSQYVYKSIMLAKQSKQLMKSKDSKYYNNNHINIQLFNTNMPRSFLVNPLSQYITQSSSIQQIQQYFCLYKHNIINWLGYKSIKLNNNILRYLQWALTINYTLYGNQPITIQSKQLLLSHNYNYDNNLSYYDNTINNLSYYDNTINNINTNIFCSLHNKNYKHSAIQIFGDNQNQGITLIKMLYDYSFKKLQKNLILHDQIYCYKLMGYALQWLRSRGKSTQNILQNISHIAITNIYWLNQNVLQQQYVIKYLISICSISKQYISNYNYNFSSIRSIILKCIQNYKQNNKLYKQTIIQQLISILICIPFQLSDGSNGIKQIIQIYMNEENNQYFYNQCRLMVQLTGKYPNELSKYNVLSKCNKIKKLSLLTQTQHYSYSLRSQQNIIWIWSLKIATTLISSQQQSFTIFSQIQQYYSQHKPHIFSLLSTYPQTLTISYIQQLHSLLQFILSLISSHTWLNIYHQEQFQKILYLLTNKLINLFNDYISNKVSFVAVSDIEKRIKKIYYKGYVGEEIRNKYYDDGVNVNINNITNMNNINQSLLGVEKDSMFRLLIQIKMMSLMKIFTIILSRSLQSTWFIYKYFAQPVYLNYKYGTSYWDRINKTIIDFIRFNQSTIKKYKKTSNLNNKLLLLNDCYYNSSQYFVQCGYLNSIHYLPQNISQLFTQIYEQTLYLFQLSSVHLIQQKQFRLKFNSLMKSHIQNYGKKLLYHVKNIINQYQSQSQNYHKNNIIINQSYEDQCKYKDINEKLNLIQRNIQNLLKKN